MDQTDARARRTSHIRLRAPRKAWGLDQRFLTLSPEQHAEFMRILDNPPLPNEKLKRLLSGKAPWEK